MFVGVGASRVRDLFNQAKQNAPCIIFIDEIDAVGRQRGAGLGGGNDEREQTLNQILVEMDGFDTTTSVIVMAATNRPDVLDPALLRPGRFDRQVTLGLPDRNGRQAILAVHTVRKLLAPDVDLNILARSTPGFSGADLSNLANEAALSAARFNRQAITMADFEAALDRIVLGTQQATLLDPQERRSVSYHESGHALVASLTPGADPLNRVTIVPHGRALGVTTQLPIDDRHTYSLDYLRDRLSVMLGGRAAEELVLGQKTTGAENDLRGASELARRMVGIWGMDDELGPVYFGLGEENPFLGRVMAQERTYGDDTASAIDRAVERLVEEAHGRALALLGQHRRQLDAIADALLQKESLSNAEVQELIRETGPVSTSGNGRHSA
jgi:cell division protease FtsH